MSFTMHLTITTSNLQVTLHCFYECAVQGFCRVFFFLAGTSTSKCCWQSPCVIPLGEGWVWNIHCAAADKSKRETVLWLLSEGPALHSVWGFSATPLQGALRMLGGGVEVGDCQRNTECEFLKIRWRFLTSCQEKDDSKNDIIAVFVPAWRPRSLKWGRVDR